MEPISKFVLKLGICSPEEVVRAAWPRAVGKKIACHTRVAKLVRTCLVVEVEDNIWQKQLFCLSGMIIANLAKAIDDGVILEVEFRIVPRRIEPRRAEQAVPCSSAIDEADGIEDPVMRGIYRLSRKKASA